MKALVALLALSSLALLACGAWVYRADTRERPPVEVEEATRELGEYPVGTSRLVFRVSNPSDRAAEVVSAPASCGKYCCLKPVGPERIPIPPGGSAEVELELSVIAPNAFEFQGNLFLNDGGLRAVKLTIRGTGVAPKGTDAQPKP
jgi:hypothetical protein